MACQVWLIYRRGLHGYCVSLRFTLCALERVAVAGSSVNKKKKKYYVLFRKAQENLNPSDQYEHSRHLKLTFSNNISGPIYTGLPVGEEGGILDLHLIESRSQNIINCGPEASAKVEIIVLEKDLTSCGGDKSLIRGDPHVTLKDGRVSMIVERSVYPYNGSRIIEAVTEPFFVKDRRSMGKRLKPLTLDDQVCKQQAIGKSRRNRLMKKSIKTVRGFLTQYFLNREELLSAYAMELVKTAFQDCQNFLVSDDDTIKMLCSSTSPNAVCPVLESAALDGYNGLSFEDYCPIDKQQQPVPNANYMPDTSLIHNYDNRSQINSSAILLDQDDFIYVTESLWDN
ncbi:hypothetical protein RND71_017630 [Anisodus tanguticus]|uniref:Calmodulin binding protein-like N-terminal domain-containing protein n=1 Tax=Anisodus tanguticus TaxID=243964 RepID=A0AAE1S3U9_9SOLA|nr:hypothetical protein RND71_017630 [Anisodus tanguticus]